MKKVHFVVLAFVLVVSAITAVLYVLASYGPGEAVAPAANTNSTQDVGALGKTQTQEEPMILYWGDGCPHCEIVRDYIRQNQADLKLRIEQKEVYNSPENQRELAKAAEECKIGASQIGVPLLYYKGQCYSGDQDCIEFIKNMAKKGGA